MKLGRNDPCHCGSGKKYKRCHADSDRENEQALREARPAIQQLKARIESAPKKLRQEYGVYINYVSPVQAEGGKAWAIGERVYRNRPSQETFHEFLIHVLRSELGRPWADDQRVLPEGQQHFLFRASNEYAKWKAQSVETARLEREGLYSAEPSGWAQYFVSVAWDVATVIHASNLPDSLMARLRDAHEFQGARYEIAIGAVFARLDCEIRFLNEDEELRGHKHVEFIATHRPSGQEFAVETKSRRRAGVLQEEGEHREDDPLKGDPRAVRRRFMEALDQAPEDLPFLVFIDINAPLELEAEGLDKRWMQDIKGWMGRLPAPTADEPDLYNAFYVTNFAPHYQGDELAGPGEYLSIRPLYVRNPVLFDITGMLDHALHNYARVPEIREDGEIL